MSKRIGHVTYEGRYVIITVPDDWENGHPLPPPGPDDIWFNHFADFVAAFGAPFARSPIRRQPWDAPSAIQPALDADPRKR